MNEILKYQTELLEQILSRLGNQTIPQQSPVPTPIQTQESGNRLANVQVLNTVRATIENVVPVSQDGNWIVSIQPDTHLYAPINASTSGDTTIVPAVSGKRILVVAYALVASSQVAVKFRSNNTDITGLMKLVEGGGIAHAYEWGLFRTGVGEALRINLSANVQVGGYVVYREV
jgi:hypothetical protein